MTPPSLFHSWNRTANETAKCKHFTIDVTVKPRFLDPAESICWSWRGQATRTSYAIRNVVLLVITGRYRPFTKFSHLCAFQNPFPIVLFRLSKGIQAAKQGSFEGCQHFSKICFPGWHYFPGTTEVSNQGRKSVQRDRECVGGCDKFRRCYIGRVTFKSLTKAKHYDIIGYPPRPLVRQWTWY